MSDTEFKWSSGPSTHSKNNGYRVDSMMIAILCVFFAVFIFFTIAILTEYFTKKNRGIDVRLSDIIVTSFGYDTRNRVADFIASKNMQRNLNLEAFDNKLENDLHTLSWKKEYNRNVAAKRQREKAARDAEIAAFDAQV